MRINIITVGKIKDKALILLLNEQLKRISKYSEIIITEIKEERIYEEDNDVFVNKALAREGEKINSRLSEKEFVIVLDPNGKEITSPQFATLLKEGFTKGQSNNTFVIGSSYGLDLTVKKRANAIISFSKLTFPHQLFRLILAEQIFRAFKIINNETYHK